MKALSIKQPWASLIAHGIKDIENRTWKTKFRGRIFIHATAKALDITSKLLNNEQGKALSNHIHKVNNKFSLTSPTSAIIGEVDIVDCVINHPSIWAEHTALDDEILKDVLGKEPKPIYNWVLANPVLYDEPILNVKGKLSFWEFEKPNLIK